MRHYTLKSIWYGKRERTQQTGSANEVFPKRNSPVFTSTAHGLIKTTWRRVVWPLYKDRR